MARSEYDDRVDTLLSLWEDDIYSGVLKEDVLPAINIYAHASLQQMTDEYNVPTTFPMLPSDWNIFDHYGNGLFVRLSSACTSIRTALQSIQDQMDCHAAIAASRRSHESLWQVFWLCNPMRDANERTSVCWQSPNKKSRMLSGTSRMASTQKQRTSSKAIRHHRKRRR